MRSLAGWARISYHPETAALDLPPIFSSRSAAIADPQSHIDAADWTKARRLGVVMVDYAFAPREIVLRAGQPYRLRIRNLGDRRHIFSAPDFFRAVAVQSAEPRGADSPAANPDSADPSTYTDITGLEAAYLPVAAAERLRRPRLFAEPDADSAESEVDTMADTPETIALATIQRPLQAITLEPLQVAEVAFVAVQSGVYYARSGFADFRGCCHGNWLVSAAGGE